MGVEGKPVRWYRKPRNLRIAKITACTSFLLGAGDMMFVNGNPPSLSNQNTEEAQKEDRNRSFIGINSKKDIADAAALGLGAALGIAIYIIEPPPLPKLSKKEKRVYNKKF